MGRPTGKANCHSEGGDGRSDEVERIIGDDICECTEFGELGDTGWVTDLLLERLSGSAGGIGTLRLRGGTAGLFPLILYPLDVLGASILNSGTRSSVSFNTSAEFLGECLGECLGEFPVVGGCGILGDIDFKAEVGCVVDELCVRVGAFSIEELCTRDDGLKEFAKVVEEIEGLVELTASTDETSGEDPLAKAVLGGAFGT